MFSVFIDVTFSGVPERHEKDESPELPHTIIHIMRMPAVSALLAALQRETLPHPRIDGVDAMDEASEAVMKMEV